MAKLKRIDLEPFPRGKCQRPSSKDRRIRGRRSYLVKIAGAWYAGKFSKQWYGWCFNGWHAPYSLSDIKGPIYEIVEMK